MVVRVGSGRVKRLVVAADGVRYAREFGGPVAPVEAVYLEPANHATPPVLYPVESILSVNGAGFRLSDYQPVERPPSPEGVPGSPASTSATPERLPYNERFPPLTIQDSLKRKGKGKGTRRKSSPPKAAAAAASPPKKAAAAAVAPKHVTPRRKSKSPSPPVLSPAPSNSNNEAGAKKGK